MDSSFESAIGWAANDYPSLNPNMEEDIKQMGAYILDIDEMRAIKTAMRAMSMSGQLLLDPRERLSLHGLPDNVIDWILGDDEE